MNEDIFLCNNSTIIKIKKLTLILLNQRTNVTNEPIYEYLGLSLLRQKQLYKCLQVMLKPVALAAELNYNSLPIVAYQLKAMVTLLFKGKCFPIGLLLLHCGKSAQSKSFFLEYKIWITSRILTEAQHKVKIYRRPRGQRTANETTSSAIPYPLFSCIFLRGRRTFLPAVLRNLSPTKPQSKNLFFDKSNITDKKPASGLKHVSKAVYRTFCSELVVSNLMKSCIKQGLFQPFAIKSVFCGLAASSWVRNEKRGAFPHVDQYLQFNKLPRGECT